MKKNRIALLLYPYRKNLHKGGDRVIFDVIEEELIDEYEVVRLKYKYPFEIILNKLPYSINKLLCSIFDNFIPFFYSWQILKIQKSFDLIIADSSAITYNPFVDKNKILLVVNIHYSEYLRFVGKYIGLLRRLVFFLRVFQQEIAISKYKTVAISNYIEKTIFENGFIVFDTILNKIKSPFLNNKIERKKHKLFYAGSGDWWGKGLDIINNISNNYHLVHLYSPIEIEGCKNFGFVPRATLLKEMGEYEIMLFPSRYESFGLVVIEALSQGVPVLMHETGIGYDLKEYIPECIMPRDADLGEWIDAIEKIESDWLNISEKCKKFASIYNKNPYEKKWNDCVNRMICK